MRLDGVRVLDLSRLLPGPYGTQLLADMGAEVIKVEDPAVGDYSRFGEPTTESGFPPGFDAINRGKKSVTLDLKADAGREAFFRLAEDADVIFEQFRPGVVDRLGIDYETVREHNPEIVYCSLSGYGQDGPYEQRVGHDLNYIGFAGLLDMTREDKGAPPVIPGYPIADMSGGLFAAFSITGALLTRELGNSGGEYIDVSLMEAVMSLSQTISASALFGDDPRPGETGLTGQVPWYDVYEAADGRYVTLAALEPKFWEAFCEEVGLDEYLDAQDRTDEPEYIEEVRAAIADVFAGKTQAEWEETLGEKDVMFGVVRTPREMIEDPHVEARGIVKETEGKMARIPHPAQTSLDTDAPDPPVPGMGEHTEELLAAVGYSEAEIERLRADEVI